MPTPSAPGRARRRGGGRLARSTIPRRSASRVETAHAYADSWEEALRRFPLPEGVSSRGRRDARRAIGSLLERYRREGHVAGVVAGPGGQPVVVIVGRSPEDPAADPRR